MLIDTADEESLKARTGAESESKMKKREDEELALAEKKDGKDLSPKELEVLECLWSAKKAKSGNLSPRWSVRNNNSDRP